MSAKSMSLVSTKIAPSKFTTRTWAEVKALFRDQVFEMACPGQRNQVAQVQHGWAHIKGPVLSSQSTLQVVQYAGPAKRFFPAFVLVDGYHRVHYWMSLENDKVLDACPFEELNLEVHTVTAKTKTEAQLMTDAIARSFNSQDSVKKNGDFLTAAVRQAGLEAQSVGYTTGRGSGVSSFLSRVVGTASTPTPVLTETAKRDLEAHQVMDRVMLLVESSSRLRSLRGRMFNPGVMEALFSRFQVLSSAELSVAIAQLSTALSHLAHPHATKTVPMGVVAYSLLETFTELTTVEFVDKVRSKGNREQQYNYLRDYLKEKFILVGMTVPALSSASARI